MPEVSSSEIVPKSVDVVALCNQEAVVASDEDMAVVRVSMLSFGGQVVYPLGEVPTAMALDGMRGLLYVGVAGGPGLMKVDLTSGEVTAIPVDLPVIDVALGEGDWVFASVEDASVLPERKVALVNGVAGAVEGIVTGTLGDVIAYDPAGGQLLSGEKGDAAGMLRRHAFDPVAKTLVLTQEVSGVGSGCSDLVLSPDAQHLVLVCAGGNDGANNVLDYDPADLTHVKGQWATETGPLAVAFNPLKPIIAISSDGHVRLHDTSMPDVITGGFGQSGCFQMGRLAVAPNGQMYYGLDVCPDFPGRELYYEWEN